MSQTLGQALDHATERLSASGIENARLDARLLVEFATGFTRTEVIAYPERILTTEHAACLEDCIGRRAAHEPVSRIIGSRGFWGLTLALNEDTLDPRADSETLISALLKARPEGADGASISVLDLGTGTGCLLLALLSEWSDATGLGVDISDNALVQAKENAVLNGLEARAQWQRSNWTTDIKGSFDVVVSNPPYIPSDDIPGLEPEVKDYDPRRALDGGVDGLSYYVRSAEDLDRLLTPSGMAAFEVGDGQADTVIRLFEDKGYATSTSADLSGIARCVLVWRG